MLATAIESLPSEAVIPIAIGAVGVLAAVKYFTERNHQGKEEIQEPPELPNKSVLTGHTFYLANHKFALDYFKEEGAFTPTFRFSLPFTPCILTTDPLVIKRFLATGFKEGIYEKPAQLADQFSEFIGKGIFTSNGKEWHEQRNIATPLFHRRNLQKYVSLFHKNTINLIETLNSIVKTNDENYQKNGINLQDFFLRYTLDSFCELGFGVNIQSINSKKSAIKFQKAFDFVQTYSDYRVRLGQFWKVKEFFYKDQEFHSHLKYMDDFVNKIIKQRKDDTEEELEEKNDLLSQLLLQNIIKQRENSQIKFTDKDLRDWVMNFLIAGRDTTAILLTWFFYITSRPENSFAIKNIQNELCELLTIDHENFNPNNLNLDFLSEKIDYEFQKNQKYLHKSLQETLRLFPPVPIDGYVATRDDVITTSDNQQFLVKKGTTCIYSAYATHRSPRNFEDPEKFNPDRFDQLPIPFSFVPFHAGPRICLGQELAMIEAKILISSFLSQFRVEVINGDDVAPRQAVILTTTNGVYAHLHPL